MSNKKFCCEQMRRHVEDGIIIYDDRYRQYDIVIDDNGQTRTLQKIDFCPWSGTQLPLSLRDKWFDELLELGIDPLNDPIPEPYRTSAWRKR